MDDTFTIVAPAMPKRQIDPFALRLGIVAAALTVAIGSFSVFLVAHERAADRRAAATQASGAPSVDQVGSASGGIVDSEARASLDRALTLAQAVHRQDGTFAHAGPIDLETLQPSLLFVDGPSTTPRIVSMAARTDVWAAAAQGPSGVCYWVVAASGGPLVHATGAPCTGAAALGAGSQPS